MKYGVLRDNGELIFRELKNENDVVKTLQKLVDGDITYKSIKEVCGNNVDKDMKDIHLVLNDEYKKMTGVRPTMLIENDLLVGTIVFVRVEKLGKQRKTVGLTDLQVEKLPDLIDKYIISENLKKAFGV